MSIITTYLRRNVRITYFISEMRLIIVGERIAVGRAEMSAHDRRKYFDIHAPLNTEDRPRLTILSHRRCAGAPLLIQRMPAILAAPNKVHDISPTRSGDGGTVFLAAVFSSMHNYASYAKDRWLAPSSYSLSPLYRSCWLASRAMCCYSSIFDSDFALII